MPQPAAKRQQPQSTRNPAACSPWQQQKRPTWQMAAYSASCAAFVLMHFSVGQPSPILSAARHLAKRAPAAAYSWQAACRPSSPRVLVSPGQPSSGTSPSSTCKQRQQHTQQRGLSSCGLAGCTWAPSLAGSAPSLSGIATSLAGIAPPLLSGFCVPSLPASSAQPNPAAAP